MGVESRKRSIRCLTERILPGCQYYSLENGVRNASPISGSTWCFSSMEICECQLGEPLILADGRILFHGGVAASGIGLWGWSSLSTISSRAASSSTSSSGGRNGLAVVRIEEDRTEDLDYVGVSFVVTTIPSGSVLAQLWRFGIRTGTSRWIAIKKRASGSLSMMLFAVTER